VFAKYGYPQIAVSAITDKGPELTQRYPTLFLTLGSTTAFANSVADILKALVDQGKIGRKVAMVNVADAFGIELAEAARPIFKQHGLELVFDKSYPLGTQDMAPIMKGAKASNPDAFVAWSYPPDTFALAELAKIEGLNVKAYYSAVATCFPAFGGKFGKSAEGVLGAGGIDPDSPDMKGYFEAHKRITGVDADYWAGPVTYASLQVLEQAIEGTGGVDRAAVTDYIKKNSFKTVLGAWTFKNQVIENYWTVGQWQGGKFVGVASTGKPGEKPVQLKSGW
jgi:branched-chain amino acid transport system substrate-binding protein